MPPNSSQIGSQSAHLPGISPGSISIREIISEPCIGQKKHYQPKQKQKINCSSLPQKDLWGQSKCAWVILTVPPNYYKTYSKQVKNLLAMITGSTVKALRNMA